MKLILCVRGSDIQFLDLLTARQLAKLVEDFPRELTSMFRQVSIDALEPDLVAIFSSPIFEVDECNLAGVCELDVLAVGVEARQGDQYAE